jgi:hypothetical protein
VYSEAYNPTTEEEGINVDMVHHDWGEGEENGIDMFNDPATRADYDQLFAWDWHTLFPAGDSRHGLTWRGRFSDVASVATHFWSAGDRTFFAHPHENNPDNWLSVLFDGGLSGNRAWSLQEKLKGRPGPPLVGGFYEVGGWGINPHYDGHAAPDQITEADLLSEPYFLIGDAPNGTHVDYVKLFDPAETESASDYLFRATLLSTFVPSKQLGTGGRSLDVGHLPSSRQFEMQSSFDSGGWYDMSAYEETTPEGAKEYWDHGDYKKIGLLYVWKLYDTFIQIGEL